jgi:TonB-linked SusC/RagA family outer membrane protein
MKNLGEKRKKRKPGKSAGTSRFLVALCCVIQFLFSLNVYGQKTVTVSGTVSDPDGQYLPGVNILKKGTTQGTITDTEGNYRIEVPENTTLVFSFIGFNTQEVPVKDQSVINITLAVEDQSLSDVIVVGYGTQSKRTVTSAISKVSGDVMENASLSTAGEGLKGKISGVRVYTTNNTPGAEVTFRVRDGSSLGMDNNPLVLVDGIERTIAGINPNDIASVEVLKDAASSAIYGSRASNGVILITTKRGAADTAPQITFNSSWSLESATGFMDYLSAEEAITLERNRQQYNPNASKLLYANGYAYSTGNTSDSHFSTRYLEAGEAVPNGYKTMTDPLNTSKTIIFQDNDWVEKCFPDALWQNYDLSISGGTQAITYAASIGYNDDSGVGLGTSYDRFTARANADVRVTKKLKFSANMDFSQSNSDEFSNQYQIITRGMMTASTQKFNYDDGAYEGTPTKGMNSSSINPLFYSHYATNANRVDRTGLNGILNYDIVDGLKANVSASLYTDHYRAESFRKADPFYTQARNATANVTETQRKKFEAYLNYDKTFKDHSIGAMTGYSYQQYNYFYFYGAVSGAASDKIETLNSGSTYTNVTSSKNNDVMIGFFGRVNYDYKKKYMMTFTFRQDATSRFLKGSRWGFFPGASAGWMVSDENFMKNISQINNLKFRISYGKTGNNAVGYTDALGTYGITTKYNGGTSIATSTMPNGSLTWESTKQLDLGIDLGVLKKRVQLSFDYFNKYTDDMLTALTLPNTTGYGSVTTNYGKIRFYGWDLEINTTNIDTKDFKWTSKFTWNNVKNKVVKLPDNGRENNRIGGYTTTMADGTSVEWGGTAEGETLDRIYGQVTDHIITTQDEAALWGQLTKGYTYQDNGVTNGGWDWTTQTRKGNYTKSVGDYTFKDLDGNNIIDGKDYYLLGNTRPTDYGGMGNAFTYKNLTLDIYVDWTLGHAIRNTWLQRNIRNFFDSNTTIPAEVKKAYDPEGNGYGIADASKAKYARFGGNDADELNNNYRDPSNTFVQKGDFLCIRDISLQYDVPKDLLKRYNFSALSFILSGHNLGYITDVIGLSPEVGGNVYASDYNTYPTIRRFSLGLRLTF